MKKYILLMLAFVISTASHSQVLIDEDFESYEQGDPIAFLSEYFTTWSLGSSEEDAYVSTEYAASGTNSIEIEADSVMGGPTNLLMPLDFNEGVYSLEFKIYVPDGFGAYYNMQTDTIAGVGYGWEVLMGADGEISVDIEDSEEITSTYNHAEWITLKHVIDLDNDEVEFILNGTSLGTIDYFESAGSLNLYAYAGGSDLSLYYIDDVVLAEGSTGIDENIQPEVRFFPNPATDVLNLRVSETSNNSELNIFNLNGEIMYSEIINKPFTKQLDVSNWTQGIYFIQINDNGISSTRRLVVK